MVRRSWQRCPSATWWGYSDSFISEDFTNGKRHIVERHKYSGDHDCLISREMAKLDHLKVGDTSPSPVCFE